MAEWKKVIVSGSSAELSSLSLDTALSVANGGTGATTLTDGGVLLGSGTGAITATAVLTNGQLLIGDGSGDPTVGTLSEGNGITVTNGAGSITLAIDGTDAVTFSNNASIFSGSFSGSFEGDGSGLTGVSATSFDFDGLPTITTLNGGDFFAASQGGTESKITFANISSSIFDVVSGDATIAADGTLTISADSVALGTDTTGNYVQSLANATNGGTTITNGSAEGGAATVALNIGDLAAVAVDVANDFIAIADATDSGTKKESIADLAAAMANTGITAAGGRFSTNDGEIDHDALLNFSADEHFTQANITTVGTVTAGDVSAILPAGTVSGSEQIEDVVGGMVTGNTETNITVTYQDGDGTLDFEVADASTTTKGVVELATTAEVTTGTDTTRAVTPDALNDGYLGTANIVTLGTVTSGDVSAILPAGTVSGSTFSSPSQGTLRATINGVQSDVDLGLQTGDSPQFTDLTVTGDLTVQGTTTTLQTTNLSIEDQFITIASGSQSATDGGLVVSKQADGAGFAVGYDTTTTRWVLDADLAVNATNIVADAYLSTIEVSTSAPSAAPVYGGAGNGYGNMHVKTDTGDIYIYA